MGLHCIALHGAPTTMTENGLHHENMYINEIPQDYHEVRTELHSMIIQAFP